MISNRKILCLAALVVSANGCTETSSEIGSAYLRPIDAQHVGIRSHGGPEAIISAVGEISIDGRNLALNASQRDLASRYFANAHAVREDGFATGMAGASTAITALTSVVSGLANGEPDKIGQDVEAKAAKIEQHVEKLCRDLRELATTQSALAASVPEFKPYALIVDKNVDECHHG